MMSANRVITGRHAAGMSIVTDQNFDLSKASGLLTCYRVGWKLEDAFCCSPLKRDRECND